MIDRSRRKWLGVCSGFALLVSMPPVSAEVALPVVPVSAIQATTTMGNIDNDANNSRMHLLVEPGVNEVVPISKGHINRIIVPFDSPRVHTSSEATTEVKGNVIYVVSDTDNAVTLFIAAPDNEEVAVSLTLVPRVIPPKELRIKLPEQYLLQAARSSKKAKALEVAQPFVETITRVLKTLAKGDVPDGYDLGKIPVNAELPTCSQSGLKIDFHNGQRVSGAAYMAYIGLAENISKEVIELQENACSSDGLIAVAGWPDVVLQPGQKTELFVLVNRPTPSSVQKRQPLI